jgi:hypothetical protein
MVLYLTAGTLDQGYHDRNQWFSTLLQQPLIKEIMIETLGSVPYCSIPWTKKIIIETLGSVPYCSIPRSKKS